MDFGWEDEPELTPEKTEAAKTEAAKRPNEASRSSKDGSSKNQRMHSLKPKIKDKASQKALKAAKKALKAALYQGLRDIPDIIPECRAHNLNEFRIISYVHVYIY